MHTHDWLVGVGREECVENGSEWVIESEIGF